MEAGNEFIFSEQCKKKPLYEGICGDFLAYITNAVCCIIHYNKYNNYRFKINFKIHQKYFYLTSILYI